MREDIYETIKNFLIEKYNIQVSEIEKVRQSLNIPLEYEVVFLSGEKEREEENLSHAEWAKEVKKLFEGILPYVKIGGLTLIDLLALYLDFLTAIPTVVTTIPWIKSEIKKIINNSREKKGEKEKRENNSLE